MQIIQTNNKRGALLSTTLFVVLQRLVWVTGPY